MRVTTATGGGRKGSWRSGKARTAILLWLLGVPIPLIILFFVIKSCLGS